MKAPSLEDGKYSIMSSEYHTGIVLNTNGTRYFQGDTETIFWFFASLADAECFIAKSLSMNPDKEYSLYGAKGHFVYTHCIDGIRK